MWSYKQYNLDDGTTLLDFHGFLLVHIPEKFPKLYNASTHYKVECGGWELGKTRKGRDILRLKRGKGYIFTLKYDSGNRNHNDFTDFTKRVQHSSYAGKIFTKKFVCSSGGGQWYELWVYPAELYHDNCRPEINTLKTTIIDEI